MTAAQPMVALVGRLRAGTGATFWLRDSYCLFQHINDDGVIHGTARGAPAKFVGLEPTPLDVMPTYVVNNLGHICGPVESQTVCYVDGMTGWHSSDNPTVGGVTGTTLFDFFYCNAAGACMRMPAGPEEYRGSLGRIRINDLGTVAFGGDSALTLFE